LPSLAFENPNHIYGSASVGFNFIGASRTPRIAPIFLPERIEFNLVLALTLPAYQKSSHSAIPDANNGESVVLIEFLLYSIERSDVVPGFTEGSAGSFLSKSLYPDKRLMSDEVEPVTYFRLRAVYSLVMHDPVVSRIRWMLGHEKQAAFGASSHFVVSANADQSRS